MKLIKNLKFLALLFSLVFLYNCNDDSNGMDSAEGTSKISVKLVDGPGDFDNVFVEVVDVMVKVNDDSEDDSGWVSLDPINTGVYDLLDLTGGVNVLLVDDFQIPSGMLNQIRLVLGDDNTVVIDGETFPLNTPSAQQSGLKVKVNEVLEPGFTYDFVLDFDVEQSIVIAGGSGNINLKPVIYASAELSSGIIEGAVTPFDFQTVASVMVDGEEVSAYTDDTGVFMLYGVPAGTYTVTLTPDPTSGYAPTTVENVLVVNGQVTNIGTVELQLPPEVGTIVGTIANAGVAATASVVVDGEIITATTNDSGMFMLEAIAVGTYSVVIEPEASSGLSAMTVTDVEVIADTTTDLGSITLN